MLKFAAHTIITAHNHTTNFLSRKTSGISYTVMEKTYPLMDIPVFSRTAWDQVMELALELNDDLHGIAHDVVDGKPMNKAWDYFVERYAEYHGDAVAILVEDMGMRGARAEGRRQAASIRQAFGDA